MTIALPKILVVDDDSAIRNLILLFLSQKNYQVQSAEDGETGLRLFEQYNPDLVILDVILPDIIGYTVCQRMKESRKSVLVIMVTSLTDVEHHVTGLELADAYVTKPFHLPVLEKQVQALWRLLQPPVTITERQRQRLVFEKLVIDPMHCEVTVGNQVVSLTPLEFELLYCLAKHPKQPWKRDWLLREVWGDEFVGDIRVVDVHLDQIRRKIEPNPSQPSLIQTVPGFGYKFEPPPK
jgi:two-component system OmpR family response regulator